MNADAATAVILAAGEGRRLEPLTNRRPKPMVPVANRPLLEHVIEAVVAADIERIVLVVGYKQERIRNHFGDGDGWDVRIEYVEQSTQLGTGHAVLQAEPVIDGPFVLLNGDRVVDAEAVAAVRHRLRDGDAPVMTVTSVETPRDYGVVKLDGNRVTEINEKPEGPVETNRINAGVYGFSSAIFDAIRGTNTPGELTITGTLNEVAERHGVTGLSYDGRWLDVSNLWDVLTVNAALIHESDYVHDASEANRQVGEGVTVTDDVILAGNVRVGPTATLSGATAIGSNVSVGANAVVENSVVLPDAVIEPGAVVRDAVIAENAHIGSNATIAGGAPTMVVGDVVHRDVDLGGVVGDNASIGIGATLTGGAVVGDGARTDAGVIIDGRIESDAVVRRG